MNQKPPEKDIIVGGQAVIEGVMMRTPNAYAVSVRRQDGSIVSKSDALPKLDQKYPWLKIPVLRGGAVLIHSMMLGIKALNFSATIMMEDEEANAANTSKAASKAVTHATLPHALMLGVQALDLTGMIATAGDDSPTNTNLTGDQASAAATSNAQATATAAGSIVFALFFNILLFVVLPLLLTNALFIYFGWTNAPALQVTDPATGATGWLGWLQATWHTVAAYLKPVRPSVSFNLVDGLIRMIFFLIMIYTFSRLKDIKRIFEYHGAEHKTVYDWEAGQALTVENARRFPRQHPRCGTSFLMLVMMVSIILFSVVKFDSLLFNLITRIALMPVVAGISYEIIRAAGKKEASAFFSFITRPGIWMQNLTTREPDDQQLEVAIHALKESLQLEPAQ